MGQGIQTTENCRYCEIAGGLEPCQVIFEDNLVIAFAPDPDKTVGKYHYIIMPKEHYSSYFEVPPEIISHMDNIIRTIGKMLKEKYGVDDFDIFRISNPDAAESLLYNRQFPMVHFHYNVIPRMKNDGLMLYPEKRFGHEDYEAHYEHFEADMTEYLTDLYEKAVESVDFPKEIIFIIEKKNSVPERIVMDIDDNESLLLDVLDKALDRFDLDLTKVRIFTIAGQPISDKDLFYPLSMAIQTYGNVLIIKERFSDERIVSVQ